MPHLLFLLEQWNFLWHLVIWSFFWIWSSKTSSLHWWLKKWEREQQISVSFLFCPVPDLHIKNNNSNWWKIGWRKRKRGSCNKISDKQTESTKNSDNPREMREAKWHRAEMELLLGTNTYILILCLSRVFNNFLKIALSH